MAYILGWCFCIGVMVPVVLAGMPWSSSPELNRVPGLHPYNARIAYPQFLAMGTSHDTTRNEDECRRIPADCPESCRKVDRTGCAVCACDNHRNNNGDCPEPPANCPSSCRKREQGCNVCKCDENESDHRTGTSSSGGLAALRDNITTKCTSMLMCMVKCQAGYKLGDVIDSRGCQPCRCIKGQGHSRDGDDHGDTTSTPHSWSSSSSNNELSGGHDPLTGTSWNNGGDSSAGSSWSNGGTGTESEMHDVWKTENGVGSDGDGCSGPMCPGSSGINPMHPGGGSSTGGGAGGCTGPFCANGGGGRMGLGIGGGASSSSGGGGSACTGPFCISGGMSGGGGMMGGSGGSMGGSMGGSGGTGGFSPFDVSASGGSGGDTSGCSGPYCGMEPDGQGGTMSNQPSSGTDRNCEGPSCAANDGYQSYY